MEVNAADVMATNVVTVHSDASVKEIAETLLANRISAVPVIDDFGGLIGIVSEGDLIHRMEVGTEPHPSWWLEFLVGKQALAYDYIKSHGRRAADLMSRGVCRICCSQPSIIPHRG
jgi:Mg/Co/Ni transporter MgtE